MELEALLLDWPLRDIKGYLTSFFDHEFPTEDKDVKGSTLLFFGVRVEKEKEYQGKQYWYTGHNGLDIGGVLNEEVRPGAAGILETVVSDYAPNSGVFPSSAGYGNHIIITHANDYQTLYAHLNEVDPAIKKLKKGDRIELNARLGVAGHTGNSSAAHLHFEVRKDGIATDSLGWEGSADDPWPRNGGVESRWLFKDDSAADISRDFGVTHPNQSIQLASADGDVSVSVPAAAFSEPVLLTLSRFPDEVFTGDQDRNYATLASFVVSAVDDAENRPTSAREDLTYSIRLSSTEDADPTTASLYWWNETRQGWEAIRGSATRSLVSGHFDRLGWFRVMASRITRLYVPAVTRP